MNKLLKGIRSKRKNLGFESQKSWVWVPVWPSHDWGWRSQGLWPHLGTKWILHGTGNHSEKRTILWPGLSDKSWRHGPALQMAALGPISLTQGKLIFTREDNTACSEKIAGWHRTPGCCAEEAIIGSTGSVLTKAQALVGDRPALPLSPKPGAHPQRPLRAGEVEHLYWNSPITTHSERWYLPWLPLALHRLEAYNAGTISCQVEQMLEAAWKQNLGKKMVQTRRLWT